MTYVGPHPAPLQHQRAVRRRTRSTSAYLMALLLSWPTASAFAVLPDKQPPKSSPSSGSSSFSKLAKRSFGAEVTTEYVELGWGCVAKMTFSRQLKFDALGSKGEFRMEGKVLEVTFDQSANLAEIKKVEDKWSSEIKWLSDEYQEASREFQRTNERSSNWQERYDDAKKAQDSLKNARTDRDRELERLKRRPADCREQAEKLKGSTSHQRSLFEVSGDRLVMTTVESVGLGVSPAGHRTEGNEFQLVGDGDYVRLNRRIYRRLQ